MRYRLLGAALLSVAAGVAQAAPTVIHQFYPATSSPVANRWYRTDMRGGGTASIVNLSSAGGNLQADQPAPPGAAKLTTGASNNDKAQVGTLGDFGNADTFLNSTTLSYDYYKTGVSVGNAFAAPSLKLTLFNPHCSSGADCYGSLVFEPTWNQGTGGSSAVPTGKWLNVTITPNTGSASTKYGGWWWDGGFGQPNGAGGPPLRSLSQWATLFSSSAPGSDFSDANVVGLSVGIGTYNQNTIGYFDNVTYQMAGTGQSVTYDFQPTKAVPSPGSLPMLLSGLLLVGLFHYRRRLRI